MSYAVRMGKSTATPASPEPTEALRVDQAIHTPNGVSATATILTL